MLPLPNNIDWDLQDIALADKYGVTRERIRQLRNQKGRSCKNKLKRRGFWAKVEAMRDIKKELAGKTMAEIHRISGVDPRYEPVRNFLRNELGIIPIAYDPRRGGVK